MAQLTLRPNGNGASAQHARNGGAANWSRTSESVADDDASYVSLTSSLSGSVAAVDVYALANSTGQVGTINSVTVAARARYASNTLTAQLALAVRPASSTFIGSTQNLGATFGALSQSWSSNPATSAAWTWSNVDALQAGFQSLVDDDGITPTESRITQLWIDVDHNAAFDPITSSGLALGSTGDADFIPSGSSDPVVGVRVDVADVISRRVDVKTIHAARADCTTAVSRKVGR